MRRLFALILVFTSTTFSGCQSTHTPTAVTAYDSSVSYGGGDGSSFESAVIVKTTAGSRVGIRAEYLWLSQKYPGFKRIWQKLLDQGGKPYDALEIETTDGQRLTVYFEISSFFGKY